MIKGWAIFLIVLLYLGILFLIAYYAERREKEGRSIVANPYIYSLSLAVYCTAWTFYGSVGKAATSGLSFLTIYLGPTLMASLWMIILKKIVRIAKANRITTLSDFIGFRYGKSLFLSALFTIVAVIGIIPYIGLQIKAIINTMTIISGETTGTAEAGLFITAILGFFAVIFGARRLDASERHGGLVFAIAFESIVKLVSFILVGLFVTFFLFDGFYDVFKRMQDSEYASLLFNRAEVNYSEWFALIILSMMAIMFLPRQFQMAVVENYDESHISKASWLFPLYLFLINIFVLPIAYGGILSYGSIKMADYFVLTLPYDHFNKYLTLVAFIGGFSAATAMIIVESLALSTMVMNSVITPAVVKFSEISRFPSIILNIKRIVIIGIVYLGYLFAVSIGKFYGLVEIGLKSFELIALFGPSVLLGIYWKGGNKWGAATGLIAGFIVWFYTLIVPDLIMIGVIDSSGFIAQITNSVVFNPNSLFGIKAFDKWSHTLFWSMSLNLLLYVGVSIFTRQSKEEELQSLVFVESYDITKGISKTLSYNVDSIEEILTLYLGRDEAVNIIESFLSKKNKKRSELSQQEVFELRDEAEKNLSGAIGSSISAIIFEERLVLNEQERKELYESIKQMTESLRFSRQELSEVNRQLSYLKKFSENIIESVTLGIATIDSLSRVKYWNKEMETITGIKKTDALNRSLLLLIPWLPNDILLQKEQREISFQTPFNRIFKINISPFKDPSGGYVIIIEDITEKKKMEEQLFQASKLASIGKLTAGISHEIGNPLASISSLVQELRAMNFDFSEKGQGQRVKGYETDFIKESLTTINSHIERIARIVRSLGDFARISSIEKVASNIQEILERTINLVKYDKRFKDIQINIEKRDLPKLMVNPDQIQQVFLNLMLNALDAMPNGGRIDIKMRINGDFVEIAFSDTGAGIDDSVMGKIFDPFFTTKPLGKGTGLGLSICYGIIKEHNGTISVKSKKGEGTTFLVKLPKKANA